ncbi:MAG: hypothetical protein REI45_15010, partial [Propionicimonas sp.]|nr:hypothetical protein [Propionicimonas sp.]
TGTDARSLDVAELQRRLTASSALGTRPRSLETTFGLYSRVADDGRVQFRPQQATDEALLGELGGAEPTPPELAAVLAALDAGIPDASLWWAMRHPESCREQVLERTGAESPETTSWLAAAVAAMWGEPAAEPRLIAAIERLEASPARHRRRSQEGSEAGPGESGRSAPRWLAAVVLLRRCGTAAGLEALT